MGYTIAFPPKSANAQAKIVAFLRKNLRPWHAVAKVTCVEIDLDYDPTQYVHEDGELAYDGGMKVGFNYSSSHLTMHYIPSGV